MRAGGAGPCRLPSKRASPRRCSTCCARCSGATPRYLQQLTVEGTVRRRWPLSCTREGSSARACLLTCAEMDVKRYPPPYRHRHLRPSCVEKDDVRLRSECPQYQTDDNLADVFVDDARGGGRRQRNVHAELGIPPQTEHSTTLRLSAVEAHFYRSQHAKCANDATRALPEAARAPGSGGASHVQAMGGVCQRFQSVRRVIRC